jgi:DNA polymerase III subunit alpha
MNKFVHLHLHTDYSIMNGTIKIPELSKKLKELDMKSCAITDYGNMFAAMKFYRELKRWNIKPIIGCEIYTTESYKTENIDEYFHLVLLCQNKEGYKNLSKLLSSAYIKSFQDKPLVDKTLLEKHNTGLIALSGCLKGETASLILSKKENEAKKLASWYRDIFEERFYLELQDNNINEQYMVNEKLIQFSTELNIPIVATNNCHYLNKEDAFLKELLLCISNKQVITDPNRIKPSSDQLYLKSSDEMCEGYFKQYPQAISNTLKIADQCDFSFETGMHFLPKYKNTEEKSAKELEKLSIEGMQKKKIPDEKIEIYKERLKRELEIIKSKNCSNYYLIVADFINFAKTEGIPVGPGRGSGASSLVAYFIGITALDPIHHNLIFERFLNPEKTIFPDFDVDICSLRRDEVYNYLIHRYGKDRIAKIANFGFFRGKSAINDVGRALGYPTEKIKEITDLVPRLNDYETLTDTINCNPELKKITNLTPENKKLIDIATAIEGDIRSVGVDAGKVIISSTPLSDLVPLTVTTDGAVSTQFDIRDTEELGLVTFDLLGIKTLTTMGDAVRRITRSKDANFDIENINLNDPNVFKMLSTGDTLGVFQFESTGMQGILRELKPDCFEDLIAINALYRPGPLDAEMMAQYIERKHDKVKIDYIFPELEPILKETYGILIYQEQIQQIAATLAGYSLGEADILRRDMSKKRPTEMAKQKQRFIEGTSKKGYDAKKAEELFDLMAKFADYSFNKAHAASYALTTYRTAYLKYYFSNEFLPKINTLKEDEF